MKFSPAFNVMKNNKFNNDKNNTAAHMNAHEQRIMRGIIRKSIVAITVIMTVIGRNLPSVIRWVKQLKSVNNAEQLTLKSLFITCMGEATLVGMPKAVKNLLKGMDAPRAIIALTDNRKVVWMLNYIMDTYSMMDIQQVGLIAAQAAALGATIEEETESKPSYLRLHEPEEMSDEEVKNL